MQEHLQQYWTSEWRPGCVCVWECHEVHLLEQLRHFGKSSTQISGRPMWLCHASSVFLVLLTAKFISIHGQRGNDTSDFADVEAVKAATNLKLQLEATARKATWYNLGATESGGTAKIRSWIQPIVSWFRTMENLRPRIWKNYNNLTAMSLEWWKGTTTPKWL